jgi:hypothetical protein
VLHTFTFRDINYLNLDPEQAIYLHNKPILTQGRGVVRRDALLAPFASFTGTFTFVTEAPGDGDPLIAQAVHQNGSLSAHLIYLGPKHAVNSQLNDLIEKMLKAVGGRGAQNLIAEVEENTPVFSDLRQAGFSIYARQRIWRLETLSVSSPAQSYWKPVLGRDELDMQLLRNGLVPGQVQQIETRGENHTDGYVYYRGDQLLAYTGVRRGRHGILLEPFVHLDAEPFTDVFAGLLGRLRPRTSRPVFVCLRSYQDWLENSLSELGAQPGPRQAVMARRTVVPLKVEDARRVPARERRPEPTTPIHAPMIKRRREADWMTYDQTPDYR